MADTKKPRTFQLKTDISRRLDAQCKEHALWGSDLVNLILRRGLEEMEAGNWQLKKRAIKFKGEW